VTPRASSPGTSLLTRRGAVATMRPADPLRDTQCVVRKGFNVQHNRMAGVLKTKGYPHQYVFSEASGHVDRRVQLQTMPEAFEWVWKGYRPSGR
jgi:hypothetical protein